MRPGAERLEGLASDAVDDANLEWIASLEDGSSKRIGVNVEADHPAAIAEDWRRIDGLR